MSEEEGRKGKEVRMNELWETPVLDDMYPSPIVKQFKQIAKVIDGPVTWFRGL